MAALSSHLINGFSPLAKGLAALLVLSGAAVTFVPNARLMLGLVSARAFTRPHTLLTCAFAGDLLPSLVYAAAAAFLVRIVEPLHGARELIKYLAATIVLTAFATVICVTIGYYASLTRAKAEGDHTGDVLFRPLGGFEAGAAALLVALKQLIPDNEVALFGGALKFRAKHLPGLYVLGASVAALVLGGATRIVPFTLFGSYLSWAYLRFVQTRNGVRGDLSDEFRLASFFPQLLHPPIDRLAAACTRLTGLGSAAGSQQHQAAWRSALVGGAALPGSLDVADDAARRRERGARALEERLGIKKAASASSVPTAVPIGAVAEPASSSGGNAEAAAAQKATKSPVRGGSKPASPVPPPAAAAASEPDLEAGAAEEDQSQPALPPVPEDGELEIPSAQATRLAPTAQRSRRYRNRFSRLQDLQRQLEYEIARRKNAERRAEAAEAALERQRQRTQLERQRAERAEADLMTALEWQLTQLEQECAERSGADAAALRQALEEARAPHQGSHLSTGSVQP
ncbi:transmembrane 115 [Chlorella sorokiniana]|uniref:Transmembrane 115 n=1 Tax=Chlorella sorokiniana TaxID=3076 RepID=A0A2P6TZ71_CHLSO|nr:transmembrane 115 [Chlorella sorokiniana]|eukprot:PRW59366.1 transmembrane 115 [Chlorella sorokiniana]